VSAPQGDLLPGLREELVSAAWRARARHRRRRIALGAAVATAAASVAVVTVLAVGSSDPVAAGVEVEVVNGRIVVELTDVETRPDVVEAALRDVGLDASVTAYPVGPSHVGRFVLAVTDLPGGLRREEDGPSFAGFSAPVGLRDHLELGLGRPANGEEYFLASDAYAPGEPLSCSGVYGQPVDHLVAFASERDGLDVTLQPFDAGGPSSLPLSLDAAAADPSVADLVVTDAIATAADRVTVYLTDDGTSPFLEPLSSARGECRE
jgi:hypothetical protein